LTTNTIEIEGQDKPACVAESLAILWSDTKSPSSDNFVGIVVSLAMMYFKIVYGYSFFTGWASMRVINSE
jgi:hypothetical protein